MGVGLKFIKDIYRYNYFEMIFFFLKSLEFVNLLWNNLVVIFNFFE